MVSVFSNDISNHAQGCPLVSGILMNIRDNIKEAHDGEDYCMTMSGRLSLHVGRGKSERELSQQILLLLIFQIAPCRCREINPYLFLKVKKIPTTFAMAGLAAGRASSAGLTNHRSLLETGNSHRFIGEMPQQCPLCSEHWSNSDNHLLTWESSLPHEWLGCPYYNLCGQITDSIGLKNVGEEGGPCQRRRLLNFTQMDEWSSAF